MDDETVTIIGAGPAGLVLARILQRHGVPVVVYDQETGRHTRTQGGLLDIHEHSGRHALRAAGLEPSFEALVQPGGEARRVLGRDADVCWSSRGPDSRPEVDRGELRDLLLDSLDDGTVRWNRRVRAVRRTVHGEHALLLGDGSIVTSRMVVGADGAWSRVRAAMTTVPARYTGVTAVEACLLDARRRHPDAADAVGTGNYFVPGRGSALVGHHEATGTIRTRAMIEVPWDAATQAVLAGADATRAVLGHFTGWAPVLRSLVAGSDTPLVARPIQAVPVGARWAARPGITLAGDAAHVMSPFAGEGANIAMLDGALLAEALLDQDRDRAVAAYEADMFDRAATAAAESARNLEIVLHDPDPPRRFLDLLAAEEPGHARTP